MYKLNMNYEIKISIIVLILSILFVTLVLPSKRKKIENNIENFESKNNQIFVSIASYRDSECDSTVDSIYRQASNPKNIYVGICQQNNVNDRDCYDNLAPHIPKSNISIMRLPHFDARGPTHARYLCSTLWNNQEYFLQIDSHIQFVKDWDTKLINSLTSCGDEKSVVSYFPPANYEKTTKNDEPKPTEAPSSYDGNIPYTCDASIDDNGIVRAKSASPIKPPKKCMRVPHLAAGMLFLRSEFLKDVPFDPWLPHVFEGEEMLLSARLWTNGYNFYMPNENICFHQYSDMSKKNTERRPLYWEDVNGESVNHLKKAAVQRVRYLLGRIPIEEVPIELRSNLFEYGMGKVRTLDEFYKFIGADFEKKNSKRFL